MLRHVVRSAAIVLAIASGAPAAAQGIKAGVLTCDVSAGLGFIIGSKKQISCAFAPEGPGRREDYDGTITKFGLDLGVTTGGVMVWAVFTNTVAGPGFLAGDYVGASGEATLAAGVGANVLIGGSNWGRVTRLIICPDTIGLKATLDRLNAAGNREALAAPIVD